MRRFLYLVPFFFALLSLPAGTTVAQEWVIGPNIDFPEDLPYNTKLRSVGLPNGKSVVAAESRNESLPRLQTQLNFWTVDPEDGSLDAHWARPIEGLSEIHMLATQDQFLLFDNPYSIPQGIDFQLQGTLQDALHGGEAAPPFRIDSPELRASPTLFEVTRLSTGRFLAVWVGPGVPGGSSARILFQTFEEDGTLIGSTGLVASVFPGQVRVVPDEDGGFFVGWKLRSIGSRILGRRFDDQGNALGPIQVLVTDEEAAGSFDMAAFSDNRFFVVWRTFGSDGLPEHQLFGRRIDSQAQPFDETLPVAPVDDTTKSYEVAVSDRFGRIWLTWSDSDQRILVRQVQADGTLSSLAVIPPRYPGNSPLLPQITVDDHGRGLVTWFEFSLEVSRSLQARTVQIDNSCMENDTTLCLHQGRFQVEIDWTDHAGDIGQGRVVPFQSSDSGLFWFFNEANWEVMVKVINGCDFNGFYWIFSAATTDVAYDLKVTDTDTGLEQIYSNGLGEPAPANTDTMALMSCGHGPP